MKTLNYTPEGFKKKYGFNAMRKVLQFHGHETLPETELTKRCTYELYATCGSCSNCSGTMCATITLHPLTTIPKGGGEE